MRIYIVRHGETNLNVKGCIQGEVNEPLNGNGRDLAVLTGQGLKNIHFDVVYSSPKSRAFVTALLILAVNESSKNVSVHTDWRLREMDWGSWDTLGCVKTNYQIPCEDFSLWYKDGFAFKGPEDGESARALCDRTAEFMQELIAKPELEDKTVLISTHCVATRALLNPYYENPADFWQGSIPPNCGVNILNVKNGIVHLMERDKIYYDASLENEHYSDVWE